MKNQDRSHIPGSGQQPPASFQDVVPYEWNEIQHRRGVWQGTAAPEDVDEWPAAVPEHPPENLVGLALSGGGIRSATFSLGILQGMHERRVLPLFDYVSTVSGGGFTGGWWSAWLSRPERKDEKPSIFPGPERIEPERWKAYLSGKPEKSDPPRQADGAAKSAAAKEAARADGCVPDAALSASTRDPIHHLRLFANYLTPRKGALSGDTWRASTIVIRNIFLTWLVLLPLLLATTLVGQLYFTLQRNPHENFLSNSSFKAVSAAPQAAARPGSRVESNIKEGIAGVKPEEPVSPIRERAGTVARPLAVLLAWTVVLTMVWLVLGPMRGRSQAVLTLAGALVAFFCARTLYGVVNPKETGVPPFLPVFWYVVMGAGAAALVLYVAWPRLRPKEGREAPSREFLRNRTVRAHSRVVVALALCAAVLLLAGFSHDLVFYLFEAEGSHTLSKRIKMVSGWAAVAATVASMLFTGIRAAPTGGDGAASTEPSLGSRIVFAAAPVLTLLLLAVTAATVGRALVIKLGARGDLSRMDPALGVGLALLVTFAAYEMWMGREHKKVWRNLVAFLLPAATAVLLWLFGPTSRVLTLGTLCLCLAVPAGLLAARGAASFRKGRVWMVAAAATPGVLALLFSRWGTAATRHIAERRSMWGDLDLKTDPSSEMLFLAGAFACGVLAMAEVVLASPHRKRTLSLTTVVFLVTAARLVLPYLPIDARAIVHSSAAITLAAFALVWVVGLGWMADPNLTSLHNFYKSRLVRAYMGASNIHRHAEQITDAAPGDDLAVRSLANCRRGAPYHLINTTLNLVGGRDLTTAQRSSDSFVLGRDFCGSSRTGYRPTHEYMDGQLSLGTAVAASGAAASANMGSKTPSAALAMLLAFLNVRLAFWAPTPSQGRWREAQPRLWPFHLIRESLSQTNDLSAYCCLSDGGHFDNTGVYSLVARGCRYIVVADCGADPTPCFEDIGTVIRRCRIDFGAEIDLKIDNFLRADGKPSRSHHVVGTITYTPRHAHALKWKGFPRGDENPNSDELKGVIVWIKPALTAASESVDIRQYALQNTVFPQQTTADQWFDEAQFESYRQLGENSSTRLFPDGAAPTEFGAEEVKKFFDSLRDGTSTPVPEKSHFDIRVVKRNGVRALQLVEAER